MKLLLTAILVFGCTLTIHASELPTVVGTGAKWHLHLDDWDGEMTVLSAELNRSDPDMVVLNADVEWLGRKGTLEAREYRRDPRRSVRLLMSTPDGSTFEAEGMLGRDNDRLMAGVTRYALRDVTHFGAWYATAMTPGSGASKVVTPNTNIVDNTPILTLDPGRTCTIEGRVTGLVELGISVTISATGDNTRQDKTLKYSQDGTFRASGLTPGSYRVTVNPAGKLSLNGTGIDQTVGCPGGQMVSVRANITGASE